MFVSAEHFIEFLFRLKESSGIFDDIIVPYRLPGSSLSRWGKLDRGRSGDITFDSYRTVLPLKFLLYPPRENVFPSDLKMPKRLIAGVKACDLQSLHVLDSALLYGNFVEPRYSQWREMTTIISSDCGEFNSSCHCNLLDGKPYATDSYDLNISSVDSYYVIKPGSEKGRILFEQMKSELSMKEADIVMLQQLDNQRKEITEGLKEANADFERNGIQNMRSASKDDWKSGSHECVGCGACTSLCPTCYCLILNDESDAEKFIKQRTYDSCQWYGYARVAGGGTPRPKLHERFRNRYLCKFDYMQSNFGLQGCTGCGRCIEACTGGIDFRDVLKKISQSDKQIILA
jgi:sulfhydrogenase subunit beta (sulfur reductase)